MFGLTSKGWSACSEVQRKEYKRLFRANPEDPRLSEIIQSLPRPIVTYPAAQDDEEEQSAVIGAMRSGLLPIPINLLF